MAFVAMHIHSVHTLEVLLILFHKQTRTWSIDEVHAQVKSSVSAAQQSLVELVESGLIKQIVGSPPVFQYTANSAAFEHRMAELATMYAERRTAVVELIYSRPARVARPS